MGLLLFVFFFLVYRFFGQKPLIAGLTR